MGLRTWLTTGVLVVGLALPAGLAQAAAPVAPAATALSLSVSTTRLTHGADLTISARLTSVDTGAPAIGRSE